ncbi:helix-turn-helix domain-containing protein [Tumebacillus lipolyticus]|uniref:Helix-turn-helix domain-containing protein n=1 Tax=Tumebacillus lipolyticus TaxID=1280370 RepID=A0ABW5A3B2_9BACL
MIIGDRLKKLRKKRGWTQEDLAARLGIGRTTYAGYEQEGYRTPDVETLYRLADILECLPDYLVGRSDSLDVEVEDAPINDQIEVVLAERLRALRMARGWTQNYLAESLGITRPAYTAYESGSRKPNYETLQAIARIFNVTLDTLLSSAQSRTVAEIRNEIVNDLVLDVNGDELSDGAKDRSDHLSPTLLLQILDKLKTIESEIKSELSSINSKLDTIAAQVEQNTELIAKVEELDTDVRLIKKLLTNQ